MIHLPSLLRGTLTLTAAALLSASSARAVDYAAEVQAQLALSGTKTIATATVAQIEAATWAALRVSSTNAIKAVKTDADQYLLAVLSLRADKNTLAPLLITGALPPLVTGVDADLAGRIANAATASSLGLLPATQVAVAKTVITKMPVAAQTATAFNVGKLVAANVAGVDKTVFASSVTPVLLPNKNVVGAFCTGVSDGMNDADLSVFTKTMFTKAPTAIAEISYSAIALSSQQAARTVTSAALAASLASNLTTAQKGLVAQGLVKASVANTASIIQSVITTDATVLGKGVFLANVSAFSAAVAGAVVSNPTAPTAADTMGVIASTIASGTYYNPISKASATLSDLDKSTVAKTVITTMPAASRLSTAFSVGKSVSATVVATDKSAFAAAVTPVLIASKDVVGAFCAGVSENVTATDLPAFLKTMITKAPTATAEISYAVVGLTSLQADRAAASASLAASLSSNLLVAQKGLVAEGLVKASGTANTAAIIQAVIGTDATVLGKGVQLANVSAFTTSVASAVVKDLTMHNATDTMGLIASTIASGTYYNPLTKTSATLSEADKTKVAAAAVKVAPQSLSDGDHTVIAFNPANAAVSAILATGGITDAYKFAITAATGAGYDNAGQVANAAAIYLTSTARNPVALTGTAAQAVYLQMSGTMIKALPAAATAISQRLAQLIDPSGNQANRVQFATDMAAKFAASPATVKAIAVGVSNTDYQFADDVVTAVLSHATAATKATAATIAGAVASTVPTEKACQISLAMGKMIVNNTLPVSQAGAIAQAIAAAATVKNSAEELQVVAAQMIGQLLSLYQQNTPRTVANALITAKNNTIVAQIAAVAKSVATIAYNSNTTALVPNNPNVAANQTARFSDLVAGAAADMVYAQIGTAPIATVAGKTLTDQSVILDAIKAAIQLVTPTVAGDNAIATAMASAAAPGSQFSTTGTVNAQETPTTNF